MTYVLAVDGGNTKTLALVADHRGVICGQGRSGSSDIYNTAAAALHDLSAVDFAVANIKAAVQQAVEAAHIRPTDLRASAFNLAGADWPEDYALFQSALQARRFGVHIHIQNDAFGILRAVSPENVGVVVVCGTGAATGARGYDGRTWQSSFWQQIQGSEHLSQQAIAAVLRSELGLEAPTTLTRRVLDLFGLPTVEEVLHALTARQPATDGKTRLERVTVLLLDEAETGDRVARRIVQQHGQALGDYAAVAARRVGLAQTTFSLVLAGGVFRHPTLLLADALGGRVREIAPGVQVQRPQLEPIIGVLFTAFDLAGISIGPSLRKQMLDTQPDAAFFETEAKWRKQDMTE